MLSSKYVFATNEPINQQIYNKLRQAIVTCEIAPGALLSEKEIATTFDVSRQPVREAFIKLSDAGLVQILPQRGTFVVKISAKCVIEGRFIREAIETAVVRKLCEQITDHDLALLKHNLLRQELAAQSERAIEFLQLDDEFHAYFAKIIDCSLAWECIQNIKATMDRVRFLSLRHVSPPQELIQQHYQIYYALEKRDPDAAEKAIRTHLSEIIYSISEIAKQHQEWFDSEIL